MVYPTYEPAQPNELAMKIKQLQTFPTAPLFVNVPQIDYVKGMDGAKEYLKNMPAGGKKVLMDQDEAIFYVVSKDANGTPAPVAFAHFALETEAAQEAPVYATKQDFDAFKAELREMLKGGKQ